ncbi:ABC transporter ATP-binding protein [Actinopolymorpha singaporensis]|uniref:Peptide/nickel transport system ATP-binding protein n=1 Tax=Actinopolymorpha singaporensis TaxID=117157 RepID=A0A1H1L6L8_9ACTN|nr:dipeptide ABC transporter ATP-binding protein [Actinopolymorpha singaporensis]SDR69980.1 peptide/nickel transport system ATP-binding protein [Actinopolymorpha singaporensis]
MNDVLLEVTDLKKHFPIKQGFLRRTVGHVKAVDGVNLSVKRGETFSVVGESGCGKSTTGRTILRLEEPTDGSVVFDHSELGKVNIEKADNKTLKRIRPEMQIIFQDPFSSLDSRMTVGRIIAEPMIINNTLSGRALRDRIAELLTVVGLRPEHASRYPHAFSGGQRQRIGIARALALNPKLIICDEPVSALDVSVQAQVLNLLEDLQQRFDLTYLFISHDLSVVEHISDRVAVMYVGKVVEVGTTDQLFYNPKMPYTEALLSSLPQPDPRKRTRPTLLTGDVPSPANPPSGCYFHTRCPYAQDICRTEEPPLRDTGDNHMAACHFSDTLELKGASRLTEVPVAPEVMTKQAEKQQAQRQQEATK